MPSSNGEARAITDVLCALTGTPRPAGARPTDDEVAAAIEFLAGRIRKRLGAGPDGQELADAYRDRGPTVEVIGYRDDDQSTDEICVFVDGELRSREPDVIDPGLGYVLAEWQEDTERMLSEGRGEMSQAAFEQLIDWRNQAEESEYMTGPSLAARRGQARADGGGGESGYYWRHDVEGGAA